MDPGTPASPDTLADDLLHVVVTRLNVKFPALAHDKARRPLRTAAWLAERMHLFETYCLPSMVGQRTRAFRWLVYIDTASPADLVARFEALSRQHAWLVVRPIPEIGALAPDLRAYLRARLAAHAAERPGPPPLVVTTRLDSDDALARTAVGRIQQATRTHRRPGRPRFGVNLTHGYQLHLGRRQALTRRRHPCAFLSVAEDPAALGGAGGLGTVMSQPHGAFKDDPSCPLVQVEDGRHWLWTIHERNVYSVLQGWPTLDASDLARFGVDASQVHLSLGALVRRVLESLVARVRRKLGR
jgi:hypothetical protein